MAPWLEEFTGAAIGIPAGMDTPELRFGALCEAFDAATVTTLCRRLKAPRRFQQLAEHVAEHGATLANWTAAEPDRLLRALDVVGALAPQRDAEPALRIVEATADRSLDPLRQVIETLATVTAQRFEGRGLSGKALGDAIRHDRLKLLESARSLGFVSSPFRVVTM
jgi:tRNA nucleotidyltransferase (CCA-adding enzyme)